MPDLISHLTLDLFQQLLQPLLARVRLRPPDPQALSLIRLGDEVEVHVVHDLVRHAAVVLQDVVLVCAGCAGDPGGDGKEFGQLVVGDVGEFGAVVFGDDELRGEGG